LEEFVAIESPFDLWDTKWRFQIKARLVEMITVDPVLHIIWRPSKDGHPFKHQRVQDEVVISNFGFGDSEYKEVPKFPPPLDGATDGPSLADPALTFKVSGSNADAEHMTLDVIPKLVSNKFEEGAGRLCHELILVSLEDHAWYLKTWHEGGVGIVKLHNLECSKDFKSRIWDHTTVQELLS
jgi:hypothetical protein